MRHSLVAGLRGRGRSLAGALHPRDTAIVYRSLARAQHTRVDLVGPPDPTSNLRPVIYDQPPSGAARPSGSTSTSPYSTSEFAAFTSEQDASSSAYRPAFFNSTRIRKERTDARNHDFWAATNVLFHAHLAHRLAELPPGSPLEAVERVKTDFYRDWVHANEARMDDWVRGWWSDLARDLGDGVRRALGMR